MLFSLYVPSMDLAPCEKTPKMMLTQLPGEVLRLIIAETLPEGFESFLLTCKAIYALGQSKISRHNELKRRYGHLAYVNTRRPPAMEDQFIVCSLQLLREISQDPLIARYIVTADLKNDRGRARTDDYPPDLNEVQADGKRNQAILRLLEESPYLRAARQDPSTWLDAILGNMSKPEFAPAFLLTLLPNVRELALPVWWGEQSDDICEVLDLLDTIPKMANQAQNSTASLSKLTTLKPMLGTGYEARAALQTMTPFLAIHSVREFYGGSLIAVDDGYTGYPFHTRYDTFGDNLEVVELAGSLMTPEECVKFTKRMSRLKTFRLSYECKWHGCGHDWSAGAFTAALMAGTSETLEYLSLSVLDFSGAITSGISTLKGFGKLRELELDTCLLQPKASNITGEGKAESENWVVPRLIDLLPASLEKLELLTLSDKESMECLQSLFTDFVAERDVRLSHLGRVSIRQGGHGIRDPSTIEERPPLPEAAQHAREAAGVDLVEETDILQAAFTASFEQRFDVESWY